MNDGVVKTVIRSLLVVGLVFFASFKMVGRDQPIVRPSGPSYPTSHDMAAENQSAAVYFEDLVQYGQNLYVLKLSDPSSLSDQTIVSVAVLKSGDWVEGLTPPLVLATSKGVPIDGLAGRFWREEEWIGPITLSSGGDHFVDLVSCCPRITRFGNQRHWR